MAHIQVEASVRTHHKFLKAGGEASWLWLCSVGYSQDGLTDGFIPTEALPYLGVKSPNKLKDKLVEVRLWDEVPGGWKIHDYEQHNRTAAQVQELKSKRGKGGHLGGRPTKETFVETLKVSQEVNHSENPSQIRSDTHRSDQIISDTSQGRRTSDPPPYDVWFRCLTAEYPRQAVTIGHMSELAFFKALSEYPQGPIAGWAAMQANLENQKAGHQWRVKGMIPKLEKWLREGSWMQQHEATPLATVANDRTVRAMTSAAEFIKGGES